MKYKIVTRKSHIPSVDIWYKVVKNNIFETDISDYLHTLKEAEEFLTKLYEMEKINEKHSKSIR